MNYDRVGEAPWDILPWDEVEIDLEGYRTQIVGVLSDEKSAGGSAANTIYGIGKFGLRTAFMGAVDTTYRGDFLLESFEEAGVNVEYVVPKEVDRPGEVSCVAFPSGSRLILVTEGANKHYDDADAQLALAELIPRGRLLHLTSFANDKQFEIQERLLAHVPEDLQVSFSPGAIYVERGFDALETMLARSDFLFFNLDELSQLTGYDEVIFDQAAQTLLDQFPRCRAVVLTLGSGKTRSNTIERYMNNLSLEPHTSIVFGRNEMVEVPVQPLLGEFVDSVGAGDAYAAGFLYGALTDRTLHEAAHLGSVTARLCIAGRGARVNLPTQARLAELVG